MEIQRNKRIQSKRILRDKRILRNKRYWGVIGIVLLRRTGLERCQWSCRGEQGYREISRSYLKKVRWSYRWSEKKNGIERSPCGEHESGVTDQHLVKKIYLHCADLLLPVITFQKVAVAGSWPRRKEAPQWAARRRPRELHHPTGD